MNDIQKRKYCQDKTNSSNVKILRQHSTIVLILDVSNHWMSSLSWMIQASWDTSVEYPEREFTWRSNLWFSHICINTLMGPNLITSKCKVVNPVTKIWSVMIRSDWWNQRLKMGISEIMLLEYWGATQQNSSSTEVLVPLLPKMVLFDWLLQNELDTQNILSHFMWKFLHPAQLV